MKEIPSVEELKDLQEKSKNIAAQAFNKIVDVLDQAAKRGESFLFIIDSDFLTQFHSEIFSPVERKLIITLIRGYLIEAGFSCAISHDEQSYLVRVINSKGLSQKLYEKYKGITSEKKRVFSKVNSFIREYAISNLDSREVLLTRDLVEGNIVGGNMTPFLIQELKDKGYVVTDCPVTGDIRIGW